MEAFLILSQHFRETKFNWWEGTFYPCVSFLAWLEPISEEGIANIIEKDNIRVS